MSGSDADRWRVALENCASDLARAGYASSTIERTLKHVRKFAAERALGPWDVTHEDVERWYDSLTCSPRGAYVYRTSLRVFYRWAYRAGRVFVDPTEATSRRQLRHDPPASWVQPIEAYRRWMVSAGFTRQTIDTRMQWLVRMARELPVAGPWDATGDVLVEWHSGHRWGRETARSVRYTVRSFYGWAHEAGHVQDNPSLALPTIRTMDQSRMPADDRDYGDALAAAGPREALILRLGAELGLRRAEIAQVHARDVQDAPDGAWLRVLGKGGKLRHLPLPDDLAEVIRERAGRGFLFRGDDRGHLSPRYVGKIASGLLPPGVTLHSLRHRFATRAYAADRDVFAVQQLLGHAQANTTQRYVKVPSSALRATVAAAR